MAGNVWEWCLNTQQKPGEPEAVRIDNEGGKRVIRGGTWNNEPEFLRVSFRYGLNADTRLSSIGFRLAQDLS